ncbi:RNase A-like domain-containing protein [Streptomyces griseoluteus]|uniref:RNase A-like domain-containing protein n=1 Tax=Streptomyces griseoluteus TaxID=29306 RepID=UPI00142ED807
MLTGRLKRSVTSGLAGCSGCGCYRSNSRCSKGRGTPRASTCKDLAAAEKATGDNLAANQAAIQQWLSSAPAGSKEAFPHTMDSAGRKDLYQGLGHLRQPEIVITVLKKGERRSYYTLTSFPEI